MRKKWIVILSATAGGLLLNYLNVPAAMVGSMLGTAVSQLLMSIKIDVPVNVRGPIWVIMGCYIGLGITTEGIRQLKSISGAVIVMTLGVTFITLLVAYTLHRFCKMGLKEAFLSSLPAGLSEIGMNAEDFKVDPITFTTIHLMRLITILALIPLVLKLLNS